ncbi:MAG TPA: hypothetical protein VI485_11715 [Vicinamibacterales bacterium]|nr:hypothetical protein [Vicinamibacterales bacterium]
MRTLRTRLLAAALLGLLFSARAEAQFRVATPASGENFHVELGLMFWQPTPQLLIQTGGLAALGQTEVDFVQEFAIENKRFKEFRGVIKAGKKHKLRVSHVLAEYNESAILRRTISFGGQTFPVSVAATADLKWEVWRFGYEWDFVAMDRGVVGFVTELKLNKVSADLAAPGFGSELTEVSAPIPTIGMLARVYPHKTFSLTAEFTGFKVPGFVAKKLTDAIDEDVEATEWDLDIYGTLNFGSHVGAQLGYRSLTADYLVDEDAGNLKLKGMYFGGLVRF